jgi:hypothetical protein
MTQLLGGSRIAKNLNQDPRADARMTNMLNIARTPATIREMKQVYFYVGAESTHVFDPPNKLFYGYDGIDPNYVNYFAPLGTTRQFNISEQIANINDLTLPRDKYLFEINLVECTIDANPSNWSTIPDKVLLSTDGTVNTISEEPCFKEETYPAPAPTATPDGSVPVTLLNTRFSQANKLNSPQSLFCRIKELSNGEPYNWVIVNSGEYTIDKSHQLMVQFNQIQQSNLTLEFGHLIHEGFEPDYQKVITNTRSTNFNGLNRNRALTDRLKFNQEKYTKYRYVDYNSETYNVFGSDAPTDSVQYNNYPDGVYPKGDSCLVQPASRPPFFKSELTWNDPITNEPRPVLIQSPPLFFNQQVSKINFRLSIKIVTLF